MVWPAVTYADVGELYWNLFNWSTWAIFCAYFFQLVDSCVAIHGYQIQFQVHYFNFLEVLFCRNWILISRWIIFFMVIHHEFKKIRIFTVLKHVYMISLICRLWHVSYLIVSRTFYVKFQKCSQQIKESSWHHFNEL